MVKKTTKLLLMYSRTNLTLSAICQGAINNCRITSVDSTFEVSRFSVEDVDKVIFQHMKPVKQLAMTT